MYSGGSVVGKASTIGIDLAHPSPNFHRGSKSAKFGVIFTITHFEPLAFENAAVYPNAETNFLRRNDRPMSSPSLVKLGP